MLHLRVPALCGTLLASLALAAPSVAAPPDRDGKRKSSPAPAGKKHAQPGVAKPGKPGVGARSIGDPLFPQIGNGGYDALHYDIRQSYDPATTRLTGRTRLTARATQSLKGFSLDFQGLTVSGVEVDGKSANFSRQATKLVVDPRRGNIRSGKTFVVEVAYSGVPEEVIDPDGSSEGWYLTEDGAYVVGEPVGAQGWFPNNNTPRDKATFDIRTTVPTGYEVSGNGRLVSRTTGGGRTTFHWRETHPMSTYLATSTLGRFDVFRQTILGGIEQYDLVDSAAFSPERRALIAERLGRQDDIVASLSGLYGPYPFDVVGAAVDFTDIGYALESQSISNYSNVPRLGTIAHEIAHQWFGNSVTPREWVDIWLNEGFADFVEWHWSSQEPGGAGTAEIFAEQYARPADDSLWIVPPASPTAEQLFDEATYTRGAMTLEGLRQIVGDTTFFRIMRLWQSENRYGVVDTGDFIALAERESGRELSPYFQDWLYESGKPAPPSAYAG